MSASNTKIISPSMRTKAIQHHIILPCRWPHKRPHTPALPSKQEENSSLKQHGKPECSFLSGIMPPPCFYCSIAIISFLFFSCSQPMTAVACMTACPWNVNSKRNNFRLLYNPIYSGACKWWALIWNVLDCF